MPPELSSARGWTRSDRENLQMQTAQTAPAIVLVHPQMGENIGAAARVMANFGLHDLRLVAPRDGWPNPAAETMSAGALPEHVAVTVFDAVEAAIADLGMVIATTARPRGMEKPVLGTGAAVQKLKSVAGATGLLFGAEKSGLENEAVALCDAILTYPVNARFSSLNLAQSVAAFAHAWAEEGAPEDSAALQAAPIPATKSELQNMMEHFEDELARAGFFHPEVKKPVMIQNLRNAFTRAGWTSQEVRTFRGAIKALALGRGSARIDRPGG